MTKHFTFVCGVGKRFAVGICLDYYSFNIDFGPFWIGIQW